MLDRPHGACLRYSGVMVMVLVPDFTKEGDDNIAGSFHHWTPSERVVDAESICDFDRCWDFPEFSIGIVVD